MTILGSHTVAEVDDLIAAKDTDLADFATKRAALSSAPDATWDADFAALQSRYSSARTTYQVMRPILASAILFVPNSMIAAEDQYQAILSALYNRPPPPQGSTPVYSDTVYPGGFQDLADRMLHSADPTTGAPVMVDESNIPQPTATDVDLNTFNALQHLPGGNLPSVIPWWVWAAGGVVIVGLGGAIVMPLLAPILLSRRM